MGDEVVSTTMTTPPAHAGTPPHARRGKNAHARRGKNVRVFSPPFLRRGGGRRPPGWSGFPFVLALVLCALSLSAQAQSKCLMLDPELQASYSGGCKDGKAEGQ